MASPYGKTSGGTDQVATAGFSNEEIHSRLENGFSPVPIRYTIDFLSPVWLRTELPHTCLLTCIPDSIPLPDAEQDDPTSSQAGDVMDDPAEDSYSELSELYPALTRSELDAVRGDLVDVFEVDEEFKDEFLRDTQNQAEAIRRFLFKQIAPMAVGASIAFDEFNQELSSILNDNVTSNFTPVKQMLEDAITMKTFEFLTGELELSNESSRNVLAVFLAKRMSPGGKTGKPIESILKDLLSATKGA